jgi:hypothetical protein
MCTPLSVFSSEHDVHGAGAQIAKGFYQYKWEAGAFGCVQGFDGNAALHKALSNLASSLDK